MYLFAALLTASLLGGILIGFRYKPLVLLRAIFIAIAVTCAAELLALVPFHDKISSSLAWSIAGHVVGVVCVLQIAYVLGAYLRSVVKARYDRRTGASE
jgi:hypothetical protein